MGEQDEIKEESPRYVEIMDSTLRDGEQTNGVSFLPHEKLVIARMLLRDVNVDRIEVASARVSEGEKEAVKMICFSALIGCYFKYYLYFCDIKTMKQSNLMLTLLTL